MTALEKAISAAKAEVGKLRKRRIPEYPGSWKTHEGLGHENLDEVSEAVARAVLMAVREPGEKATRAGVDGIVLRHPTETWLAMIDAILNEKPKLPVVGVPVVGCGGSTNQAEMDAYTGRQQPTQAV